MGEEGAYEGGREGCRGPKTGFVYGGEGDSCICEGRDLGEGGYARFEAQFRKLLGFRIVKV